LTDIPPEGGRAIFQFPDIWQWVFFNRNIFHRISRSDFRFTTNRSLWLILKIIKYRTSSRTTFFYTIRCFVPLSYRSNLMQYRCVCFENNYPGKCWEKK
jgi:hypothetical protein